MNNYFKFSKGLHFATLCCFLFPFFFTGCEGCGPSREELIAKEKAKQDSIEAVNAAINDWNAKNITTPHDSSETQPIDTTFQNNIPQVDASNEKVSLTQPDTANAKPEKNSETPSEKFSNKFTFLRQFLIPEKDTYTGVATVIDAIPYIHYFAIFIAFLLLLISLVIKFIDRISLKTIVLLDILALIFLYISHPTSIFFVRLWGFWVAITFMFALTICDFYLIKLSKRLKT